MNYFEIVEKRYPERSNGKPFIIIEIYITSEGYRTRVTSFRCTSFEKAMRVVEALSAHEMPNEDDLK